MNGSLKGCKKLNFQSRVHEVRDVARETGKKTYYVRDNARGSHDTYLARDVEESFRPKLNVIKQPTYTPEVNVLDASIWKVVKQRMVKQERDWEKAHPGEKWEETLEQFKSRARSVAFGLPEDVVRGACRKVKTNMAKIVQKKGWYIRG